MEFTPLASKNGFATIATMQSTTQFLAALSAIKPTVAKRSVLVFGNSSSISASLAASFFFRAVALVVLLVGYTTAADPKIKMPMVLRVLIVIAFSIAGLYKLLILTVSLPVFRAPPQNRRVRLFFVDDLKQLLVHCFEAYYAITILAIVTAFSWPHSVPLVAFLPFLGMALVPIAKVTIIWLMSRQATRSTSCFANCSRSCWRQCCYLSMAVPLMLLHAMCVACHPLDAGLHVLVALASLPMEWYLQSNLALVIMWGVHSSLVALALFERVVLKRLEWKDGRAWLVTMQFAVLSVYVALALCEFPKGLGEPHYTDFFADFFACLDFVMVTTLTLHINWDQINTFYQTWQNQNGHFTLRTDAEGGGGGRVAPVPPARRQQEGIDAV